MTDSVKPRPGLVLRAGTRATSFLIDRLPEFAILLASTLALGTWYGGESLVWGEDATHPMSLGEISTYFHIPDTGLGAPDARKVPFVLPIGAALAAWRELGIPYDLVVLQPVVVVGLLTAAGWSSLLLVRRLLPTVGKTAALAAALFYMFNPYSLTTIWSSMSYLSFHYAFLPLVLTSWLLVLTKRVSWWFVPPAAALWALTLTPSYITTPVAVTDTALLGAVTVFAALTAGGGRAAAGALGRGALLYGIWLVLNVFWIVPLATFAGAETARGLAAGDPQELFALNSAPFAEAIRLAGYWGVSSSYAGSPYFAWYRYFAEIGSKVAFAFPLLAIVAMLAIARSRTELRGRGREAPEARSFFIFFVVLLLSALTLMAGVHEPFGWLKERVVETFGLVGPFRSVYQRFGVYVAVAYVPVVAVGIWILQRTARERAGAVAAVVATGAAAAAVAVLPALPLWTGSAFGSSGFIPSRRITVPTDYLRLAPVLDKDRRDSNVLVLPYGGSGATVLNWEDRQAGYVGIEPLSLLTRKPVLTFDATAPYLEPLAAKVAAGGRDAVQALQLLNARVVVIHNDADYDYLVNRVGVIDST